jgi:hypothetical protein
MKKNTIRSTVIYFNLDEGSSVDELLKELDRIKQQVITNSSKLNITGYSLNEYGELVLYYEDLETDKEYKARLKLERSEEVRKEKFAKSQEKSELKLLEKLKKKYEK